MDPVQIFIGRMLSGDEADADCLCSRPVSMYLPVGIMSRFAYKCGLRQSPIVLWGQDGLGMTSTMSHLKTLAQTTWGERNVVEMSIVSANADGHRIGQELEWIIGELCIRQPVAVFVHFDGTNRAALDWIIRKIALCAHTFLTLAVSNKLGELLQGRMCVVAKCLSTPGELIHGANVFVDSYRRCKRGRTNCAPCIVALIQLSQRFPRLPHDCLQCIIRHLPSDLCNLAPTFSRC